MHVRIAMFVQTYYLMQYFKGFIWITSEIGKNMNISTNWASLHVNSYRWVCKQRTVLLVKHKSSYLYVLKRGKQQHCCGINSYLNTSSWYANKVNAIRHPLLVWFFLTCIIFLIKFKILISQDSLSKPYFTKTFYSWS